MNSIPEIETNASEAGVSRLLTDTVQQYGRISLQQKIMDLVRNGLRT